MHYSEISTAIMILKEAFVALKDLQEMFLFLQSLQLVLCRVAIVKCPKTD